MRQKKLKKQNRIIFYFVIFTVLIGCVSKTTQVVKDEDLLSVMKDKTLSGDRMAYEKLETYYMDFDKSIEFLPYAFLMSNKYDYSRAYYDVFEKLLMTSRCSIDYKLECIDALTRELALKYLKLAIEKGDKTASNVLLDYYDKGKSYPIKELYEDSYLINQAKTNIQ